MILARIKEGKFKGLDLLVANSNSDIKVLVELEIKVDEDENYVIHGNDIYPIGANKYITAKSVLSIDMLDTMYFEKLVSSNILGRILTDLYDKSISFFEDDDIITISNDDGTWINIYPNTTGWIIQEGRLIADPTYIGFASAEVNATKKDIKVKTDSTESKLKELYESKIKQFARLYNGVSSTLLYFNDPIYTTVRVLLQNISFNECKIELHNRLEYKDGLSRQRQIAGCLRDLLSYYDQSHLLKAIVEEVDIILNDF